MLVAPERASRLCASGFLIKRIVALPGDVVRIGRDDRSVTVISSGEQNYTARERIERMGRSEYFVVGDNVQASCDSRNWGPVARNEIVGPVVARYWPVTRLGRP